ncbi:MAG: Bud site selection protein 20 [Thelocarpon impressellum]|nr:MAG: Bud site selection protein 20 [Thelocarpon impressellum]
MGAVRRSKTKRRTRDLDLVHADLRSSKHLGQHKDAKEPEDLPGLGQWYCVECAKWFEGEHSLIQHRRGKNHKRRVRLLREEPYTQKEAEAAVGLGTDNGRRARPAGAAGRADEGATNTDNQMEVANS